MTIINPTKAPGRVAARSAPPDGAPDRASSAQPVERSPSSVRRRYRPPSGVSGRVGPFSGVRSPYEPPSGARSRYERFRAIPAVSRAPEAARDRAPPANPRASPH